MNDYDDSKDIHKEFEEAVQRHVSTLTGGDVMTGFVLLVSTVDPNRDQGVNYLELFLEGQPSHVTLGMLEMCKMHMASHSIMHHINGPLDDDH